jgi:hypothetical protein
MCLVCLLCLVLLVLLLFLPLPSFLLLDGPGVDKCLGWLVVPI